MKEIVLLNSDLKCLVDDEDFEELSKVNWSLNDTLRSSYAIHWLKGGDKRVYMHRVILNVKKTRAHIDHINGDKLDNRKENLRICKKQSLNQRNQVKQKRKTSSIYKGVCFDKRTNLWTANIKVNGKKIWLRRHNTQELAAKAYDKAARKYFKEYANLNFKNRVSF